MADKCTTCLMCGNGTLNDVVLDHSVTISYESKSYGIRVPDLIATKCDACGEVFVDNRGDRQISAAIRDELGLLQPNQIAQRRHDQGLSQTALAKRLRVSAESISRWESGKVLQSQSNDQSLRVFFADPSAFDRDAFEVAWVSSSDSRELVPFQVESRYHYAESCSIEQDLVDLPAEPQFALAA